MPEVGSGVVTIRPDLRHFSRDLTDGVNRGIDGSLGGIKSGFAKIGKVAAVALAGVGVAGAGFLTKAVTSASDLNETMSKVGVVFGDQQKIVTGFANQMAKDFGTPKREILDAAASIGLIGKASGLSQKDAGKMSTQLAKLAVDAQSFYNVPLPEALQAIQSGLVGEAEPMRRFGVLLNAQAVDAEAARLGLAKVGKEYSEGAKAQARASLIMAGMADASGDLERTQGSLANRIKEVRGRLTNFAADVGTKLIPVALDAIDLFGKWGAVLSDKLGPVLKEIGGGLRAMFAAFKDGGDDVTSSGFAGALERIGVIARNVSDQVGAFFKTLRTGFTEDEGTPVEKFALFLRNEVLPILVAVGGFIKKNLVPILAGLGAVAATLIGGAAIGGLVTAFGALVAVMTSPLTLIAALVAGLVYAYQNVKGFRNAVDALARFLVGTLAPALANVASVVVDTLGPAVEWVKQVWPEISEAIGHVLQVVREAIGVFVDYVSALWRAWGDDIFGVVKRVFESMGETINNALQIVTGIIRAVIAIINGEWGKAWDALKSVVSAAWDQVKNIITTAVAVVKGLLGGVVSAFGEVLRPLGNLMHTWVGQPLLDIVETVRGMPGKIAAAAVGMFNGIKDAFRSAINWIIRAWNGLDFEIPGFDPPGPGPKFKGFALGVPDIKELAKGGSLRPGEFAFTGEDGPELIKGGLAGNHVFPNDLLRPSDGGASVTVGDVHITGVRNGEDAATLLPMKLASEMFLVSG